MRNTNLHLKLEEQTKWLGKPKENKTNGNGMKSTIIIQSECIDLKTFFAYIFEAVSDRFDPVCEDQMVLSVCLYLAVAMCKCNHAPNKDKEVLQLWCKFSPVVTGSQPENVSMRCDLAQNASIPMVFVKGHDEMQS